jgi:cytochrome P450
LHFLTEVDEMREASAAYWSTTGAQGYWLVTNMDGIRGALQDPSTFSNGSVQVTDPDPAYNWIPEMLDPPEHTKWRQNLSPLFSPARIARLEDNVRARAVSTIEAFAATGRCEAKAEFADRYPTAIFLEIMGLPVEDTELFLGWSNGIMNTPADQDPDGAVAMGAMTATIEYFTTVIAERRRERRDDLVSAALSWTIDGQPIPDADLLSMCLLLFMAGLDTVTCQLMWSLHHLATHPDDRRRLVEDPSLIPSAVEEFLRVYTIVRPARKIMRDVEWQGCPMKAGEMIFLPLSGACRDPQVFSDPGEVVLDRSPNNHIAFGAGPHRCLGSHLARREMRIALEEWLTRIPDFRIADGATIEEWGGHQLGLVSLPLVWDTA